LPFDARRHDVEGARDPGRRIGWRRRYLDVMPQGSSGRGAISSDARDL
jgi:hypothetical protein